MSDETIDVVDVQVELGRHTLAKMVVGTVVGFIASKMAEKAYDAGLAAYRKKAGS